MVAGEIDIALTDGPIQHPLLHSRLAYQEAFYLVTPLSQADRQNAGESTTVFMFNKNCFYREHFESWLQQQRWPVSPTMAIESYQVIMQCVSAGLGISCFPASIATRLDGAEHGVQVRKLDSLAPSEIHFVWRRNTSADSLNEFIEFMCATTADPVSPAG